jgi:Trp operon repressor
VLISPQFLNVVKNSCDEKIYKRLRDIFSNNQFIKVLNTAQDDLSKIKFLKHLLTNISPEKTKSRLQVTHEILNRIDNQTEIPEELLNNVQKEIEPELHQLLSSKVASDSRIVIEQQPNLYFPSSSSSSSSSFGSELADEEYRSKRPRLTK